MPSTRDKASQKTMRNHYLRKLSMDGRLRAMHGRLPVCNLQRAVHQRVPLKLAPAQHKRFAQPHTQETVARNALAAIHAFEQKARLLARQLEK